MADNYLERRFEEHERQSYAARRKSPIPKQRKVLFVGALNEVGVAVVRAVRAAGHRIATCSSTDEPSLGVHHHINIDNYNIENLRRATDECIEQLGGIDIIIYNYYKIIDNENVNDIADGVRDAVAALLVPSRKMIQIYKDNGEKRFGRIVCISELTSSNINIYENIINGALSSAIKALADEAGESGITANSLTLSGKATSADVARISRFIIDEANGYLTGRNIEI